MNIAFRTDASSQIGTGHFMRCLTLAVGLKQHGIQIRFVSRNLPDHLHNMLATKGMELVLLKNNVNDSQIDNLAHSAWLGISQAQDAQDTIQALSGQSWDWLIVDHYALDTRWETAMRETAKQIMVIDDIADRQHECDVLLDQNFYSDMQTRYSGKVPAHCQLLLGPRYVLLREEFRTLREQIKPHTGEVKRLLVFFGGVDADNYTGHAIKALADMTIKGVDVDVVIGAQHPCRAEIETNCAALGFVCHVQTDKMAELMATADLAIGAGGSATWERCCLGLPSLIGAIAHNQIRAANDLSDVGAIKYLGMMQNINLEILKQEINKIYCGDNMKKISSIAFKLVDGNGVSRLVKILEKNNGR